MTAIRYVDLESDTPATVTVNSPFAKTLHLQIVDAASASGVKAVFFTLDESTPVENGDGCECISAGIGASVTMSVADVPSGDVTVKLTTSGSCTVQARLY